MKLILFIFSLTCLILGNAQTQDSVVMRNTSLTNNNILYLNVTNPVLHGKAGLALSLRRRAMDYFIYGNYIFGPGYISNTIYFTEGQYGIPDKEQEYESFSGFDFGVQFRFRNSILSKPYLNYVKDAAKYTKFYTGLSAEITYVHVEDRKLLKHKDFYSDAWMWNPKLGLLMGWTLNKDKVYFDLNLNLMLGWSYIKAFNVPESSYYFPDEYNFSNLEFYPMIFKYEFSFLVGYNLLKP